MATKAKKKTTKKTPARVAPKTGLSGYLVIWRHNMDDVPVGLFANREEALKVAQTMSFQTGYAIARKLGIDCSTPVCFAVCEFTNGKTTDIGYVTRDDDAI